MKRIIATSLIVLFLFSQTGITVATHYCGGHAVKSAVLVGNKLPGCGMEMMQSCEMNSPDEGPLVRREPCCQDHLQTLEANEELLTSIIHTSSNLQESDNHSDLSHAVSYVSVIAEPNYASNSPPLIEQDFQIDLQTFLI